MDVQGNEKASCNLCGAAASRDGQGRPERECPGCGSHERQRTFQFMFDEVLLPRAFSRPAPLSDCLLFAPAKIERDLLLPHFERSTTSALFNTYKGNFVRADIRDLSPFENESFDFVQACNILDYVPELTDAVRAVARVLKPGGFFCFHLIESNILPDDAPVAATVRSRVKSAYYPPDYPVPNVKVGRETLRGLMRDARFRCDDFQFIDPVTGKPGTWWLGEKAI